MEKNMKKIIIAFVLITHSLLAYAGQPLSKNLITSFFTTMEQMDALETKYPKEFKRLDEFSIAERSDMIRYIRSSKAYPDISATLSENGFSSVEEFMDVSERFMGSMYSVQMSRMPKNAGMNLDNMDKMMEANIKEMKQNGAPKEVISDMENQLQQMKKQKKEMRLAMNSASKDDIQFVNDNLTWLMSIMPDKEHVE